MTYNAYTHTTDTILCMRVYHIRPHICAYMQHKMCIHTASNARGTQHVKRNTKCMCGMQYVESHLLTTRRYMWGHVCGVMDVESCLTTRRAAVYSILH